MRPKRPFNLAPLMTLFTNIKNYFQNAAIELQKVTWPSKTELTRYTVLVVAASVLAAVFFSVVDMGFSAGVEALLKRRTPEAVQQDVIIPQDSLSQTVPVEAEVTPITDGAVDLTTPPATETVVE